MKQKRKTMTIIVALIAASVIGLIALQVILLEKAYELNMQAFRQNVNAALSSVVEKLETKETVAKVVSVLVDPDSAHHIKSFNREVRVVGDTSSTMDSVLVHERFFETIDDLHVEGDTLTFRITTPQHVRLRVLDTLGHWVKEVVNEVKPAGEHKVALNHSKDQQKGYFYNFTSDSTSINMTINSDAQGGLVTGLVTKSFSGSRRNKIINRVLDDLTIMGRLPIEERINATTLDSVVRATLDEHEIDLPYGYGIVSTFVDSVSFATPQSMSEELKTTDFKSRLFPGDPFSEHYELALFFPQQSVYLLKKTGVLLVLTLFLLSFIVFCFIYTIKTIFKQKQLATLLTDFINNMTHEFKTPISTIALASEALHNPSVSQNQQKVKQYGGIIHDENQRMRHQVEKILQMAVLEEGDYELNLAETDVHEVIEKAAQNISLQIEKRKGEIITDFKATYPIIEADGVHLANIIHNLLDNANKYTSETPRIHISTQDTFDGITISIEDNGIGLRPEEREHIFDKYYRVPTGNVHDVKGFGLGLSYVKLMVEAHGGTIQVQSEFQKGTTFQVFLPRSKKARSNPFRDRVFIKVDA